MFNTAELYADILSEFAEMQAIVSDPDEIEAETRLVRWRAYQREWAREKRARLTKTASRFCLCCGKALEPGARRPRLYCGPACLMKKRRVLENSSILIAGE